MWQFKIGQTVLRQCLIGALKMLLSIGYMLLKVLQGIIYPLDNFQTYPNAHWYIENIVVLIHHTFSTLA